MRDGVPELELTDAELQLIEDTLMHKIEALSACFGVIPLGAATRATAELRNQLLPLHDKVRRLRLTDVDSEVAHADRPPGAS